MTTREIFKKVQTYNELSELIGRDTVKIHLSDWYWGKDFTSYQEFRKHISREYVEELAENILKGDGWKINEDIIVEWGDIIGHKWQREMGIYIS